jgi:predicted MPP superfamily phosphohydrolase
LLAHRPEKIAYYRNFSFDLILSGHTHGGQVRIPLILNGLYAPNQGFFPKYGGGLYKHEKLVHIISRGLSINPKLPRIFNPPELVVIIIKPTFSQN